MLLEYPNNPNATSDDNENSEDENSEDEEDKEKETGKEAVDDKEYLNLTKTIEGYRAGGDNGSDSDSDSEDEVNDEADQNQTEPMMTRDFLSLWFLGLPGLLELFSEGPLLNLLIWSCLMVVMLFAFDTIL